jgi:uncharacterized RDD family membrane protein YckC
MTTRDFDPDASGQPGAFPPPPNAGGPPGAFPPPPNTGSPPGAFPPPPNTGGPPGAFPQPPSTASQPGVFPAPHPPTAGGEPGVFPTMQPPNTVGEPGGYSMSPAPFAGSQPGGLWPRFGARLIDGVLVTIVAFVLAAIFDWASNVAVTGLFSGVLTFIYFVAFEVSTGWTPGKKLLGLSVHGPAGAAQPTVNQSAIRNSFTLIAIVPWIGPLLALIAYIVIAFTISQSPSKQGKHDELAGGTQVVKG